LEREAPGDLEELLHVHSGDVDVLDELGGGEELCRLNDADLKSVETAFKQR